ncbi:MAG: hypothetical protein MUC81_00580 [Bacteroidia bacterium]|jgi:hypothetical protein|nr:hypothetical protein [Bacteroidia bacterium]
MEVFSLKYLVVVLWSTFKYLVGLFAAIGFGCSWFEVLLFNLGGGMLGVLIYLYVWDGVKYLYQKFFPPKPKVSKPISKAKRKIYKFIIRYELYGIAFLTPVLLSVPVGVLLAAAFEPNKWRIKQFMFLSFLGWTLLVYGLYSVLGIDIRKLF